MKCPFVVLLSSTFLTALGFAGDWPKFRGPTGDGHARAKSVPLKWSATENVRWKVAVPGKGWSSPVLYSGRVYLTTAVTEGNDQDANGVDRELRSLCLDSVSGKVVWDTLVFRQDGRSAPRIHKKNSHASPTPIIEGDRVYVHFGHMGTACLDLDGKVLWRQADLGYPPLHGNGGTPVIFKDLLIYSADASKNPFVVALNKGTGKVVWRKARSETPANRKFSFSTPTLISLSDSTQLVSPASGAVFSYDPGTGKELWSVKYDQGYSVIPKPVVHDNMIFIGTGYDKPNVLGIRVDGKSKGDVTESHLEWKISKRAPHTPSMLIVDGLLYFISDGGIVSCVDPVTGAVVWQERGSGPISASPVYCDGRIYFLDEKGVCTVIRAGREFEVLATNDIGERSLASVAVDEGTIYLRTEKNLFRIGGQVK
ncbi:MAG: PQQ-like beta-propeller repeat protein [Verrucomicrobiaceae bacterium]|nr:PQQ-like beta-propeller repeat protein [Verrucomicrobiaceae bacterium]